MLLSLFSHHAHTVSLPSGTFGFIRRLLHCCCTDPIFSSSSLCFITSESYVKAVCVFFALSSLYYSPSALPVCLRTSCLIRLLTACISLVNDTHFVNPRPPWIAPEIRDCPRMDLCILPVLRLFHKYKPNKFQGQWPCYEELGCLCSPANDDHLR
jgi:hypothetical protein